MMLLQSLAILSVLRLSQSAPVSSEEATSSDLQPRATYPFNKIVAFGDDLTDNGQGSYAHGITGNPDGSGTHLWGANTWTDGPVTVTYLAESLGMPITYDYAFGSSQGGGTIGSVCDNALLPAGHLSGHAKYDGSVVPSALQQITNYTTGGVFNTNVDETLHFLWTCNNDMIASLGWAGRFTICDKDTLCVPGQKTFIAQILACMTTAITSLIAGGAKYILVPSVYPRNLSPWMRLYISEEPGMIANFGTVIDSFNSELATLVDTLNTKNEGVKIMYYDANAFMRKARKDSSLVQGASHVRTCVDPCTHQVSNTTSNFDMWYNTTLVHKLPDQFYWMTAVSQSTTVNKALAADMLAFVESQFS